MNRKQNGIASPSRPYIAGYDSPCLCAEHGSNMPSGTFHGGEANTLSVIRMFSLP
ncbi:MAG: hypothetical protein LIP10_07590 [Clostridiales bacterium]|nr:hypothetical protein [Clostridiales bacterium]